MQHGANDGENRQFGCTEEQYTFADRAEVGDPRYGVHVVTINIARTTAKLNILQWRKTMPAPPYVLFIYALFIYQTV